MSFAMKTHRNTLPCCCYTTWHSTDRKGRKNRHKVEGRVTDPL
uniref:Uncharacterized protein n=1 Tax=Anguilla anguilla TaxID=7936 RepID=A0A0E9XFX6_ANGAN